MASAGLAWGEFGQTAIRAVCDQWQPSDIEVEAVWQKVDDSLIQAIDAHDCGVNTGEPVIPVPTISTLVASANPNWLEEPNFDAAFLDAAMSVWGVLHRIIKNTFAQVRAFTEVESYLGEAEDGILVMNRALPWQAALQELDPEHRIKLVVYPGTDNDWRVQSPNVRLGSFDLVHPLPEAWRGKSQAELVALTGVADVIFCHAGGFIGGARSKAGTMALALKALGHIG